MEDLLRQAERLEKDYDWLGAAESYEKALKLLPEDGSSRMGEIHEQLGHAFYRAAFQAESNNEFRVRLHQAILNYEKAKEQYQKLSDPTKTGRTSRCDAMDVYIGYWLASEVLEKKRMLNECWRLTKDALKSFEETRYTSQFGKTYNQLSSSVVFGFPLEWDFQARKTMIGEAVEHGEQTIKFLSSSEDALELARAYARTALYLGVYSLYFLDADEKKATFQKAREYQTRAKELSDDVALSELIWPIFGSEGVFRGEATDEAMPNLKKALDYARKTKDRLMIGCALDWLAYHTVYKRSVAADPDESLSLNEAMLHYAEDARRYYFPISFTSPRGDDCWVEDIDSDYFNFLAYRETDVKEKQALLEKATVAVREGLKRAEASGYIEVIMVEQHTLGGVLINIANLERGKEEKKAILQEAMKHVQEDVRITDDVQPFSYWNRAIGHANLASIKYSLAELVRDTPEEKNLIQEAIGVMENAMKLGYTELSMATSVVGTGATMFFRGAGNGHYALGRYLTRLCEITNDAEYLRKALKSFVDALDRYQKVGLSSRVAECRWKVATTYDVLGQHLKSAENFGLASDNYRSAAQKIRQLKDLYQDQASYMQAWQEIEKARNHHARQEYGSAKEHFQRAADIHKSIKQWSYLSPNYSAWAKVEEAEELSRKEQCEEALKAFEEAASLFNETKTSIQNQLGKIEDTDERLTATSVMKATETRLEYCHGRIIIEEAKILDKKGDHYSSSEKYGVAAEAFERVSQALDSEQERREFKLIIALSRAWQKMTLAEARSSSPLYSDASTLFEQAEELTPNEKTKMLILGHSRFCRALGAGTRFVDSRNKSMYIDAIESLESAATYYVKAGFPKASDYSEATKLLFDAYMHMDEAARESDPERKAKLYAMAEKVLQTSAGSFTRAEHPEKSEQVLGLLEKARKERELAVSLTEVLHAPSIISTTSTFTTPTPTFEQAAGSDRFESADIRANLIVRQRELKMGEDLRLEIELVNAGKGPALLIKVNEAIPEGFELIEKQDIYRVEDSYINLKGKRLDPLKTEEVKLVLKPTLQGTFSLKPTVLYLDENGKYKSHEPEPVTIVVKELGIKGWLKGER